jgi:hypothetical protein
MAENKNSTGSQSPRDALGDLLASIGKADASNFERYPLENELLEIANAWSTWREALNVGPYRKVLRGLRANTAKRRKLRQQLGPLREAIEMAGWLRQNPGVDENRLRAARHDNPENIDPAEIEEREDQDIAFLIDSGSGYRKRQVRTLAVEPFLRFLKKHDIVPSRQLPRSRMMRVWFDWVGVDKRLRPTDTGIRTIARDLQKVRSE